MIEDPPVWIEKIGSIEWGVWCESCMFPSAGKVKLAWGQGMRVIAEHSITGCGDCGTVLYE